VGKIVLSVAIIIKSFGKWEETSTPSYFCVEDRSSLRVINYKESAIKTWHPSFEDLRF
jgi:hypothetical protein